MIKRLEFIKDIAGNNYVGINIYPEMLHPFLEKMKAHLGDEYEEYVKYQQDRDRNHYHCTVLNVADLNKAYANLENVNVINDLINSVEIEDFQTLGLGSVQRNENKAYYVVCRSSQLQGIRRKFKLEEIDFHITLGFKHRDVFGLRKNVVLKDAEPFISELRKYYIDFESFDFIKELERYEYELSEDIYCTKIMPTYANFKVGNTAGTIDCFSVSLINDALVISCKWKSSEEIPYFSNTLILRKLNNIEK